jgi:hypothetical protein
MELSVDLRTNEEGESRTANRRNPAPNAWNPALNPGTHEPDPEPRIANPEPNRCVS